MAVYSVGYAAQTNFVDYIGTKRTDKTIGFTATNNVFIGITLGGVTRTTWPSGGGGGVQTNDAITVLSNTAGYVTSSITNSLPFYPLSSNPSNYLTSVDWSLNPSNAPIWEALGGKAATNSLLSAFSNDTGFVNASITNSLPFYPLSSNPSNYLTSVDWSLNPSNSLFAVTNGTYSGMSVGTSTFASTANTATIANSATVANSATLATTAVTSSNLVGLAINAGTNVTVTSLGNSFTINASGGSGTSGVQTNDLYSVLTGYPFAVTNGNYPDMEVGFAVDATTAVYADIALNGIASITGGTFTPGSTGGGTLTIAASAAGGATNWSVSHWSGDILSGSTCERVQNGRWAAMGTTNCALYFFNLIPPSTFATNSQQVGIRTATGTASFEICTVADTGTATPTTFTATNYITTAGAGVTWSNTTTAVSNEPMTMRVRWLSGQTNWVGNILWRWGTP